MADLRAPYAATQYAGLAWSDHEVERAVDRVAAAGLVSPFGLTLWKCAYGHSSVDRATLEAELYRRYTSRYRDSPELSRAIVDQALREYLSPACLLCHGKREVLHDTLLVPCPTCSGTGVRKYDDVARASGMQISYAIAKQSAHKIGWILNLLSREDKAVNLQLSVQLERVAPASS